jgi:hypothetical protein
MTGVFSKLTVVLKSSRQPKFSLPRNPACVSWAAQFFASSTIAAGAKEPREIRGQLRCCNWIRLPMASLCESGDEGGKKDGKAREKHGAAPQARSQNISPAALIRDPACAGALEKTSSQKEE